MDELAKLGILRGPSGEMIRLSEVTTCRMMEPYTATAVGDESCGTGWLPSQDEIDHANFMTIAAIRDRRRWAS